MSGIPPKIPSDITQEGLSTPAHEWASKTTAALDPETTNTSGQMNPTTERMLKESSRKTEGVAAPSTSVARTGTGTSPTQTFGLPQSNVSTPGVEVPGAYHEDHSLATGAGAGGGGHMNLSDTANKVSQSVQRAGETAAQYFPKSVRDTVSHYIREYLLLLFRYHIVCRSTS